MADLNAYFKSIIDQDREAVVICDLNHIIIYMNPAAVVDYGKYGGAALLGKKPSGLPQPPIRWKPSARWWTGLPLMQTITSSIPTTIQSMSVMSTWLPCGRGRYPDRLLREA